MKPHIGIFQAYWPLQVHTVNSVLMLAQAGYGVDLFIYRVYEGHVSDQLDQLRNMLDVRVHSFGALKNCTSALRTRDAVAQAIWKRTSRMPSPLRAIFMFVSILRQRLLLWFNRDPGMLPKVLVRETRHILEDKRCKALIGIEKRGLIWAGQVAKQLGIPYLYHSLELYTREYPGFATSISAMRMKLTEEKYHKSSYATIIQDERRAEVLFRDNGVQEGTPIYVPVSLLGKPFKERSSYLQEKFLIKRDQKIILQLGIIHEDRYSIELARLAQDFPVDWVLVLHGAGQESSIRNVQEVDMRSRVILSTEMASSMQLQQVVASAHIGLAFYQASSANDYLTAHSSEKIALYLQCGLPVIAFEYPGYDLLERHRCGVLIKTLQELPQAIEKILKSYNEFSSNAKECFIEYYEFSKNYRKVIEVLDQLP